MTTFRTYLGPHKQQPAALEIPDVEETAGALTSSLDSWRFPNKSQRSFRSQFFAVPAARCGSLGNALAEELLVAWFHKAMYIPALFLTALGFNHMLNFTLANKSRSRILQQRLSVPVIKGKNELAYSNFQEQDKTFEVVVAPTKTEGRDLSKKNLNVSLQAV